MHSKRSDQGPVEHAAPGGSVTALRRRDERQLEHLKHLLLGAEQERISELSRRLEEPAQRAADVAEVLAESVRLGDGRDETLADALEPSITRCVERSVQRDPSRFADALFPIVGPVVRRYIAEALRGLVESINQTLEHSLTPRGLGWRLESLRSGVPFPEIVLRHTLAYRVEQVFLIRPDDGLLIQHVADKSALSRDADAVSAMLTAIQDFTGDTFLKEGEAERLQTVQMGEHTLWLVHGPHAYLACAFRGIPPASQREHLNQVLENIHRFFGPQLTSFQGDRNALVGVMPELERCLTFAEKPEVAKRRRGASPLFILLLLAIAGLIGWFAYLSWQKAQADGELVATQERLLQALRDTPGVVITEVHRANGVLEVRGLRDPLARDLSLLANEVGLDPSGVKMQWRGFQDTSSEIALKRAERRLQPPGSVRLELSNGELQARGIAPEDWGQRAALLAVTVPGVDTYNPEALVSREQALLRAVRERIDPPDSVALRVQGDTLYLTGQAPRAWINSFGERLDGVDGLGAISQTDLQTAEEMQLATLRQRLEATYILFSDGVELDDTDRELIDSVARDLHELLDLTAALDLIPTVTIVGRTDALGTPAYNSYVGRERAFRVAGYLSRQKGLPPGILRTDVRLPQERNSGVDTRLHRVEFDLELRSSDGR